MNAKRIFAVLALALLLALCMVLTACGSDPIVAGDNPGAHEHAETPKTDDPGVSGGVGSPVCLHKSTEIKDVKKATCLAAGYTGDRVCSDCGKVLESGTVTAIGGHDYETVETILEATCEHVGVVKQVCKVCFDEETQSVTASGHQIEYTLVLVENGREKESLQHVGACKNCDYTVEAADHVRKGRPSTVNPTCDEDGYTEATCGVCNEKYRTYTDLLGHDYNEETGECDRTGCDAIDPDFTPALPPEPAPQLNPDEE